MIQNDKQRMVTRNTNFLYDKITKGGTILIQCIKKKVALGWWCPYIVNIRSEIEFFALKQRKTNAYRTILYWKKRKNINNTNIPRSKFKTAKKKRKRKKLNLKLLQRATNLYVELFSRCYRFSVFIWLIFPLYQQCDASARARDPNIFFLLLQFQSFFGLRFEYVLVFHRKRISRSFIRNGTKENSEGNNLPKR